MKGNPSSETTTPAPDTRPNILLIITDQQSADAMSCVMGDAYIHTPNMDALAANGMRFTRAYTPNPLCMPMRTSMFTGDYPHVTGIQTNGGQGFDPDQHVFMGARFRDAGYETAYFGKWHLGLDEATKDVHGFDTFVGQPAILDPGRKRSSYSPLDISSGRETVAMMLLLVCTGRDRSSVEYSISRLFLLTISPFDIPRYAVSRPFPLLLRKISRSMESPGLASTS